MNECDLDVTDVEWICTDLASLVIIPGHGSVHLRDLWVAWGGTDGKTPWICGEILDYRAAMAACNSSLTCVRDDAVRSELLRLLEEEG